MFRPTRVAVGLTIAAVALFGVGTNVQAGWLIVLTSLIAGALLAGVVLPVYAMRGIEISREAPARAWAGVPVEVALRVRNASGSARGLVLVRDRFLGDASTVVARLPAGTETCVRTVRAGAGRGVWTSGPCEVVSGAPFGVVTVTRRVEVASSTVVYPRLHPVGDVDRWAGRQDGFARPRPAPAGDTSSVREYRHGDPLRHVHWRSSARAGSLVVREFEDPAAGELAVVADTSVDGDVLDAVASVACSYAVAALESGRRVTLVSDRGCLEALSRDAVLDWGARLTCAVGTSRTGIPRGVAVVAAVASAGAAGRVADSAADATEVLAVVVGDADARGLRAAGARVLEVPVTQELGRWLTGS